VLEARSGRVYGRDQVPNEEWMSTESLVREAERQSVYDYSVRNSLIMAREMREVNCLMNPPQRPAVVMTGYHPVEAAHLGAQTQMAPVYPPSTSASAQLGLQMYGQGNQLWDAGQAREQANQAQGMLAPAQGGLQRGPSKSRENRKKKRAAFNARPDVILIRKSISELETACTDVIAHEKKEHFNGKKPSFAMEEMRLLLPAMLHKESEKDKSDDDMPPVE